MRPLLSIWLLCSIAACNHKTKNPLTRKINQIDSQVIATVNTPKNIMPLSEELNRKEFYFTKAIPNNSQLGSNLYCTTTENLSAYSLPKVSFYKIYLDPYQVIEFCDSILTVLPSDQSFEIRKYKQLRNAAIKSIHQAIEFDSWVMPEIFLYCQSKIVEIKTKSFSKSLLVKFYNTKCVKAGKDCDIVRSNGDTVSFVNNLELCSN